VRGHLRRIGEVLILNPHITLFESRERGYVRDDVSPELWRSDLRVVDTITQPEATARTLKSYIVERGKADAQSV
jgi:alkaline phosphatase D